MNDLERIAWQIANKAHENQKYGDEPYIEHIKRVFNRVHDVSFVYEIHKTARLVAILHDVIEDSDFSIEEIETIFGFRVRTAVWSITRKKDEQYFDYIKIVRENKVAKLVKTCDLVENLSHCYLNREANLGKISRYEKAITMLTVF